MSYLDLLSVRTRHSRFLLLRIQADALILSQSFPSFYKSLGRRG